jgi:hypothetical protein
MSETEDGIWIDLRAWHEARQEAGIHASGLAIGMIMGLWARTHEPMLSDPDELHALMVARKFRDTLEEVREHLPAAVKVFFVTLVDGRLVPSPRFVSVSDPNLEGGR